jgi:hypothetical protein
LAAAARKHRETVGDWKRNRFGCGNLNQFISYQSRAAFIADEARKEGRVQVSANPRFVCKFVIPRLDAGQAAKTWSGAEALLRAAVDNFAGGPALPLPTPHLASERVARRIKATMSARLRML